MTSGIVGLALLVASTATLAQESSKVSGRIPRFRGATSPGGITVDATVVNNGKSCRIQMLSDADAQIPTSELSAVEEPQHGKLEFPGPDVALYTPNPGAGPPPGAPRPACASTSG